MYPAPQRRSQFLTHQLGGARDELRKLAKHAVGTVGQAKLLRGVTIRSNVSPDIVLDSMEAQGPFVTQQGVVVGARRAGGLTEAFLSFVRPEIELDTMAGRIRVAPWGAPTANMFWPILIISGAGMTALGILALRGLKAGRRKR